MNLPRPFAKLSGDRQADTGGTPPRCDTRRASACSVFGVGMESILVSAKQRKWFSSLSFRGHAVLLHSPHEVPRGRCFRCAALHRTSRSRHRNAFRSPVPARR